jgi:WD40 repeat protein
MQFVEGQTLAALIQELRRLEGREASAKANGAATKSWAEELISEECHAFAAPGGPAESSHSSGAAKACRPPDASLSPLPPFVPAYRPGVGLSPGPVAETATPPVGALSTERPTNWPTFFQTVAKLGIQAAEALEHAHSLGVIHRDIKPGNLMVEGEPGASATGVRLWIADFGLAHCQGGADLTMSGDLLGTLRYMSPEQALAKRIIVDHRTDIYSLGATLYELLTLEPAFNGKDRQEVLRQIAFEDPKPPRRLKRSIPTELETIVLKAMEKNPAERYATAQDFADDLRRFLKGEPIRAKPVGLVNRTIKWARRRPIVVALLVVSGLALLALAGAGVGMFYNSRLQAALDQSLEQKGIAQAQKEIAHQERTEADKQRGLARRFLYFSRVGLAYRAWQDARITRMQELLDKLQPQDGDEDLRSFEWYYLKRLLGHHSLLTLKGHASAVDCVAFSKDGKRLASASSDQTAKIWDASTGREILTIKCNAGTVASVAFSPDGKRLATGTDELKIWDAKSGHQLSPFRGHTGPIYSVTFSPDGKELATTSGDKTVKVWDVETGKPILSIKQEDASFMFPLAFSPDGKHLAGGVGGLVKLWDKATGQEVCSFQAGTNYVWSVAFNSDGKRLATAGDVTDMLRVWDALDGRKLISLKRQRHTDWIRSVAFSPDDKRVATASEDRTVRIWDANDLEEIQSFKGHTDRVLSVAFNQDGKRVASASSDQTVMVWDATVAQEVLLCKGDDENYDNRAAWSLSFGPDSQRLAVGSAGGGRSSQVEVFDATSGARVSRYDGDSAAAFSPDGKRLASASRIWDVSGHEILTLKCEGQANRVAFSPDGKRLAIGYGGSVKIVDVATGKEVLTLQGHTAMVNSVAFSPHRDCLASASDDKTVKIWDLASGREKVCLRRHTSSVRCVAFDPDGKRVATASGDQTVKVWDPARGNVILTLVGHTHVVYSVAFSPDGKRLASTADDDTVKMWDATTGEEVLTFFAEGAGLSLAFSPDGTRLARGSFKRPVMIWFAAPMKSEGPAGMDRK